MRLSGDEARAAFAVVRDHCRRQGESAYRAVFFLPREKRDGIYAIGAFGDLIVRAVSAGGGQGCCGGGDGVTSIVKDRIDALYMPEFELPLPQFRDPSQWT